MSSRLSKRSMERYPWPRKKAIPASTASRKSSAPARFRGRTQPKSAVELAAKSLRDLRIAEVGKLDMKIEGGKVVAYRARVSLSFKYDA